MDWALAIARNHGALVRLVTALFAVVGLVPDGAPVASISPSIRSKIIRVLRPAESALRRLIAIAAQGVDGAVRSRQSGKKRRKTEGKRKRGTRAPIFRLFDPRKWFPELSKGRRLHAVPARASPISMMTRGSPMNKNRRKSPPTLQVYAAGCRLCIGRSMIFRDRRCVLHACKTGDGPRRNHSVEPSRCVPDCHRAIARMRLMRLMRC